MKSDNEVESSLYHKERRSGEERRRNERRWTVRTIDFKDRRNGEERRKNDRRLIEDE